MKSHNGNQVIYNLLAGLLSQGIAILVGFIIPRLFLIYYGSNVNGELSTIKQLFSYLSLLEAGVGTATKQALYKPIAREDYNQINKILASTKHYYRRIGYIYLTMLVIIGSIYPLITRFTLPRKVVFVYTLLYGLPSVINFIIYGEYSILLEADGYGYILSNINSSILLLSGVGKSVILVLTKDLLAMQLVYCVCNMIQCPIILWYIHYFYPWVNTKVEPDYKAISKKGSVLVHQFSMLITNNTDIFFLSIFGNFKIVSVYSVYSMAFSVIGGLLSPIYNSISFELGQLFQTNREKFWRVFDIYETTYIMMVAFCYTMMALFLLPVIRIYTSGVNDINYIDSGLLLIFALKEFLNYGKYPYLQVAESEGAFYETEWHSKTEMIINLVITTIGVQICGIYGCLIGTIVSLIFRCNAAIQFAYRNTTYKKHITYKKWGVNLFLAIIFIIGMGVFNPLEPKIFEIVTLFFTHAIFIFAVFGIVNVFIFNNLKSFLKDSTKNCFYR